MSFEKSTIAIRSLKKALKRHCRRCSNKLDCTVTGIVVKNGDCSHLNSIISITEQMNKIKA